MRTRSSISFALAACPLAAAMFVALDARAAGPEADTTTTDDSDARHRIDRTWLYVEDARIPAPLTIVATTNVSYTHEGADPSRAASPFPQNYDAFAANTAQPGGMIGLGAELGLVSHVSVMFLGQMGFGGDGPSPNAGLMTGLRVGLLPLAWQHIHLVASAGYLHEAWSGPIYDDDTGLWHAGSPHGDNGAWMRVSFAGEVDRLRVAVTAHGEHVFADGRDPLDVMVAAGANLRVVGPLRAGVEWVGQDLEESISPAADGGARHFVGPTLSTQLLRDRLSLVAGPSFGLSALSPRFLARFGASYGF